MRIGRQKHFHGIAARTEYRWSGTAPQRRDNVEVAAPDIKISLHSPEAEIEQDAGAILFAQGLAVEADFSERCASAHRATCFRQAERDAMAPALGRGGFGCNRAELRMQRDAQGSSCGDCRNAPIGPIKHDRFVGDESLATGKEIDEKGNAEKHHGPHCAIGRINYPGGRKGILIYIKASITGDENDYVFDYKKRYGDFPHETTLDQMFSEEQFEAYRALGFHTAYGLFDRSDKFAHLDPVKNPDVRPEIDVLDQLFPRVAMERPPGQKVTFADWLPRVRRPPIRKYA